MMNFLGWILFFSVSFWLPPGSTAQTQPAQAQNPLCYSYEMELPGETLAEIAARCQVRQEDLRQANPHLGLYADPQRLPVGVWVRIPAEAVRAAANGRERAATDTLPAGVGYRVRAGDNLTRVAVQAGLTLGQLLYANPQISNPDMIFPGQNITVPAPGGPERDQSQWQQDRLSAAIQEVKPSGVGARSRAPGERWILVDLATQTTHAYEGDRLVRSFLVSTGRPQTPTVTGEFKIWVRMRYDDMSGPGYDLKDVPYVMYFHQGYGLHGTYWHKNFGVPMSSGCVNLSEEDAGWLYEWTSVGTPVVVR